MKTVRPLALLFALLLAVTSGCRGKSREEPKRNAPAVAPMAPISSTGPAVYFVGLDGADWEMLDPLVAAGAMPNLARLVAEGSSGVLETEMPALSPILWTTMMTGVSPLEHRILDFTSFSPEGLRQPIRSDERLAPAVWNVATWSGRSVGVFGLWATWPAEAVSGVVVSDRFSSFLGPRGAPPAGAVFPEAFASVAGAELEKLEQGIRLEDLRRFLPDVSSAELERAGTSANPYADPVAGLRRMVIETRLQDALFRDFVTRNSPALAILYLESTDTVGHLFAPYFPPRLADVPEREFERFRSVPEAWFRWIDELLGAYAALARERGATLFLASDHGFRWREGRPAAASSAQATAALWHRGEGIYVLHGPGIPTRPRASEPQSIRRVAATLLALAGLAPGSGIAGPPLPPAPPPAVATVDYAARFRDEIRARKSSPPAPRTGSSEEIAKLQALGYVGAGEPARLAAGSGSRSPGSFNNEGLILRQEGKRDAARAAFERALALDPGMASAEWNLSELLWESGEAERSDELLASALRHGLGDGAARAASRAAMRLERGKELLRSKSCVPAAREFERASTFAPGNPAAPAAEGLAWLCAGDERAAERAFRRSLKLDPAQPEIAAAVSRLRG